MLLLLVLLGAAEEAAVVCIILVACLFHIMYSRSGNDGQSQLQGSQVESSKRSQPEKTMVAELSREGGWRTHCQAGPPAPAASFSPAAPPYAQRNSRQNDVVLLSFLLEERPLAKTGLRHTHANDSREKRRFHRTPPPHQQRPTALPLPAMPAAPLLLLLGQRRERS